MSAPLPPLDRLADAFADIASEAGRAILAIYATDFTVTSKPDASPVSEADMAAEAIIVRRLEALLPDVPIVAEEAVARGDVPDVETGRFFLVDPLDGTKEFVNRNGEFTVNIALMEERHPAAGVVYAPLSGKLYLGGATARAAELRAGTPFDPMTARMIHTRAPGPTLDAVASRSHLCDETRLWLEERRIERTVSAGSALKFGLVAEGSADVYPRFTPTMEWDTAAGHAVLRAAGGEVVTPDGAPLIYGKVNEGFRNGAFIAWGRMC